MGSRRAFVLVLTALAFAGCGGDDDKSDDSGDGDGAQPAVQQDAEAKSAARTLVTEMEACFVEEMSYEPCKPDAGDASLISSDSSFTISKPSESGNTFTIGRASSGEMTRTCEKPGEGGCPANGKW